MCIRDSLVHGHRRVVAGFMGAIFVVGPMWFAPRGQLLELKHNWWQVSVCLSYVLVGLAFLIAFVVRQGWASSGELAGAEGVGPGDAGQATAAIRNAPLTRK